MPTRVFVPLSPSAVTTKSGINYQDRSILTRKTRTLTLLTCLVLLQLETAFGWVFPEYRDIAVLALQRLSPERQASFQKLWSEARAGHESPLCEKAGDAAQGPRPDCIDYAAWTAISGDHSCSARDMLTIVHDAPWIVGVARVSARLKTQLAAAQRRDQHVNAVRDSDMALQRTDPDYVTRASSNNAHFLLARPSVDIEPLAYSQLALGSNSDLNALGTYVWYHLSAPRKATLLSRGADASAETHADLVRAALADEAFALHFLEDGFAAGYATGTWGNTAVRKGTHDYYSEHGLALVRGAESRLSRWATHTPGVLNESSDGLVFAEIGIREDKHASGTATLPGRGALTARFRVPFWLIPGDLVVAAPILAFTSKQKLMKMGVRAVNGGLIPWQAGIATRVGRFQFVFGREVGLAFYRNRSDHPILIPTPGVPPVNATAISLNSLQIEFPILEYRLFRTFSLNQSSGFNHSTLRRLRQTDQFVGGLASGGTQARSQHNCHRWRPSRFRLASLSRFQIRGHPVSAKAIKTRKILQQARTFDHFKCQRRR